jgi:N-acetylglucosaminyldiphosphoundecaprenol N-acetyl-beta-D-mannosaminyltransferase
MGQKMIKLTGRSTQILNVGLNSTSTSSVLDFIQKRIAKNSGFFLVTPNPAFLVKAQDDKAFRRILNQADVSLPDGVGLLWASRFLRTEPCLKERVTGADLVEAILRMAQEKGWKIGLVGARRGEKKEVKALLSRLKRKYPQLGIEALELVKNWPQRDYQLILVAYGMGKQEKWIWENRKKVKGVGFLAIGSSLDFLTGFSRRAPERMQKKGLEWLWRLIQDPKHIKRIYLACVVFPWLVLKDKFKQSCPFAGCREDREPPLSGISGHRES